MGSDTTEPAAPAVVTLVAAGTHRYARDDLADLDRVPDSLRTVAGALARIGITVAPHRSEFLLDPDREALLSAVEDIVASASVVIVYYTGHGIVVNNKYYLPMSETRADLIRTAVATRELIEDYALRRDSDGEKDAVQPDVLIILDCCFATTAAIEGVVSLLQGVGNDNVWIMTSANTMEYAQEGVFADALAACIRNPRTGFSQSHLSLDVLVGEINTRTQEAGRGQEARWFPPARRGVTGVPPFFPNIDYHPNYSGYTIEQQRHWISKLRAGPDSDALAGYYLTARGGRMRAIEELAGFIAAPNSGRMAIVTGSPGSGKSTMLAVLALLGDPRTRQQMLLDGRDNYVVQKAAAVLDSVHDVLSIHVRGMNTTQIANIVASRLESRGASPAELIRHLVGNPNASRPAPVLIVDAIDESATPSGVIEFLLELAAKTSVRCVVGTRRHLLKNISDLQGRALVDLDLPLYRDNQAVVDYARSLLIGAREPGLRTPYRTGIRTAEGNELAEVVAAAIAERASTTESESFLMARLLALAIRSRREAVDVRDGNWHNDIPDTVGAAFDEDLRRLGSRERPVRMLLTALAWAKGSGLPWETIWIPMAEAIAEAHGELTDDDVRWALDNAGSYIIEDIGAGGRSVFRVFHELLAEHLRRTSTHHRSASVIGRGICDCLQAIVPTTRTGCLRWDVAHPYIRSYLAEHARDADGAPIENLLADLDFLASADPASLSSVLMTLDSHHAMAGVYLRTARLLGDVPEVNSALLGEVIAASETTMRGGGGSLVRPRYRTIANWVRHDDSIVTIPAHSRAVVSLVFLTGRDGRGVLATVDSRFEGAHWDATSGKLLNRFAAPDFEEEEGWTPVGLPVGVFIHYGTANLGFAMWGHELVGYVADSELIVLIPRDVRNKRYKVREISAIPFGRLRTRLRLLISNTTAGSAGIVTACGSGHDGQALLAHWAPDRRLTLVDLGSGRRLATRILDSGRGGRVLAMGLGRGRVGRPILATVEGGAVCLRDPKTTALVEPRYELPRRFAEGTGAIAVFSSDDTATLAAVGTRAGELILLEWLAGGPPRHHVDLEGHRSRITTMAFDQTRSGSTTFATGDVAGTVRLWRSDRKPSGDRKRFDVRRIAVGAGRDGRTTVAVALDDGAVTIQPIGMADTARVELPSAATAMSFGVLGGREVLAVGDYKGTVQLIDLDEHAVIDGSGITAGFREVTSIRFGQYEGRPCVGVCYLQAVLMWGPVATGRLERLELVGRGLFPGGDAESQWLDDEFELGPRPTGGGGAAALVRSPRLFPGTMRRDAHGREARPLDVRFGARAVVLSKQILPGSGGPLSSMPGWLQDGTVDNRSVFTISEANVSRQVLGLTDEDQVTAAAIGPGPAGAILLAVGNSAGSVEIRDLGTAEPSSMAAMRHDSAVRFVVFEDGSVVKRLVTCDDADVVRVWDMRSGRIEVVLPRRSRPTYLQLYRDILVIGEEDGWAVLDIE
ncbi:hypothetical protein ACWEO2_28470 [Nocardia sp. NPDC004278]